MNRNYHLIDPNLIKDMLLFAARVFDNPFIIALFHQMYFDDVTILATASYASFFGNLEIIQFFLSNDMIKKYPNVILSDAFTKEVISGACKSSRLDILKYVHERGRIRSIVVIQPGLLSAIKSGVWEPIAFFLEVYSHLLKPFDVFVFHLIERSIVSKRIIISLMDYEEMDLESDLVQSYLEMGDTIRFLAKSNVRLLQLLIENPYTRHLFKKAHLNQILQVISETENAQLLQLTLSHSYMINLLDLDKFHQLEQNIYKKNSHSLMSILKVKGKLVYRTHTSMKRLL